MYAAIFIFQITDKEIVICGGFGESQSDIIITRYQLTLLFSQ